MRSAPIRVAKRYNLNQVTWFGCTYGRIAFLNNTRASCSPELMVHSKCFRKIKDNAYEIDLPNTYAVSTSFNVAKLSPFYGLDESRTTPFQEGRMMRTSLLCMILQMSRIHHPTSKIQIKGHLQDVVPRNYKSR